MAYRTITLVALLGVLPSCKESVPSPEKPVPTVGANAPPPAAAIPDVVELPFTPRPPPQIVGLQQRVVGQGKKIRLELRWQAAANATRYVVEIAKRGDLLDLQQKPAPQNQLALPDQDPGIYIWRVRSFSPRGELSSPFAVIDAFVRDDEWLSSTASRAPATALPAGISWTLPTDLAVLPQPTIALKAQVPPNSKVSVGHGALVSASGPVALPYQLALGVNSVRLTIDHDGVVTTLDRTLIYIPQDRIEAKRARIDELREQHAEAAMRVEQMDQVLDMLKSLKETPSGQANGRLFTKTFEDAQRYRRDRQREIADTLTSLSDLAK